jgi:hypothetical protein
VLWSHGGDRTHRMAHGMDFVSTYWGEARYRFDHPVKGRIWLRYRYAKSGWAAGAGRLWNFADRQEFENNVNSAHGLLMEGACEPVDGMTLRAFQEICGHPEAQTGFYCHLRGRHVPCKPVEGLCLPSHKTWKSKLARELGQIAALRARGAVTQALALADKMPAMVEEIGQALEKVLPEWNQQTQRAA